MKQRLHISFDLLMNLEEQKKEDFSSNRTYYTFNIAKNTKILFESDSECRENLDWPQ